jgi:hypothetical protein
MIHPNRLENDSILAPVAQEVGITELSLEELEAIQGGGWFTRKVLGAIFKSILQILGCNSNSNSTASTSIEDSNSYSTDSYYSDYSTGGA